jgi:hypothetical protein
MNGGITPCLPKLGTGWRRAVNFTFRPLCLWGKSPRYLLNGCTTELVRKWWRKENIPSQPPAGNRTPVFQPIAYSLYWLSYPVHSVSHLSSDVTRKKSVKCALLYEDSSVSLSHYMCNYEICVGVVNTASLVWQSQTSWHDRTNILHKNSWVTISCLTRTCSRY